MVVGLTMMKLARRKSTKARNTHTGQLDKILREAMEEREARDPDIDRERTKDNEYLKGYGQAEAIRSGDELARLLEARADRYGEAGRRGPGSTRGRGDRAGHDNQAARGRGHGVAPWPPGAVLPRRGSRRRWDTGGRKLCGWRRAEGRARGA